MAMKIDPVTTRLPAQVQQTLTKETEALETRKADLSITAGVLAMEQKVAATPPDKRPSAVDAKWAKFTKALGGMWKDAKAQGADLGGLQGVNRQIESIEGVQLQVQRILEGDPKYYQAMPPDLAGALDIVAAIGWASKNDVVTPELQAAFDQLDGIYLPVVDGYEERFNAVRVGEAPMTSLGIEQPEGFPPIGDKTIPQYLRAVAKELRAGRYAHLVTNEDRFGPPSTPRRIEPSTKRQREAVADKLESMANARDPKKPDETDFMFGGSFGHFALETSGPLAEWLASFSHAEDAYYNLMVRRSDD